MYTYPQEIHDRPYLDKSISIGRPWWLSEYHAPSVLYSNVAQYALDSLGFEHDDILILFESDLFLIKEFSFDEYLKNYDLAGYNRKVDYQDERNIIDFLWIGLLLIKMQSLTNKITFSVNCGSYKDIANGVDCGGYTHYYINNNPEARIKYFDKIRIDSYCKTCKNARNYYCKHNTAQLINLGFDDKTIKFIQEVPIDWGSGVIRPNGRVEGYDRRNIEFILDKNFLHFNGAAGYANSSTERDLDIVQFYNLKTAAFLKYINDILST